MAKAQKFQDLEEMGETLLGYIRSSQTERLQKLSMVQQALSEQNLATRETVTEILTEEAQIEESVSQKLLDMEEEKRQREEELENLEEQLRQLISKSQTSHSELQFLRKELESVRSTDHQLESLQSQVDEDTTEVIPSAVYVAQVYYLITKIKWEYEGPPTTLKGVHYGADLATPININLSAQSRSSVSDRLWGFVSSQW